MTQRGIFEKCYDFSLAQNLQIYEKTVQFCVKILGGKEFGMKKIFKRKLRCTGALLVLYFNFSRRCFTFWEKTPYTAVGGLINIRNEHIPNTLAIFTSISAVYTLVEFEIDF